MPQIVVTPRTRASTLLRGAAVTILSLSLGVGVLAVPQAHASSVAAHVADPGNGNDCIKHPNNPGCSDPIPPTATPELSSGDLVATGVLPIGAVLLYRRCRTRRAPQQ